MPEPSNRPRRSRQETPARGWLQRVYRWGVTLGALGVLAGAAACHVLFEYEEPTRSSPPDSSGPPDGRYDRPGDAAGPTPDGDARLSMVDAPATVDVRSVEGGAPAVDANPAVDARGQEGGTPPQVDARPGGDIAPAADRLPPLPDVTPADAQPPAVDAMSAADASSLASRCGCLEGASSCSLGAWASSPSCEIDSVVDCWGANNQVVCRCPFNNQQTFSAIDPTFAGCEACVIACEVYGCCLWKE